MPCGRRAEFLPCEGKRTPGVVVKERRGGDDDIMIGRRENREWKFGDVGLEKG